MLFAADRSVGGRGEKEMDGQTRNSLAEMICGDGQVYLVYRTGSELTRFFQRVGFFYKIDRAIAAHFESDGRR